MVFICYPLNIEFKYRTGHSVNDAFGKMTTEYKFKQNMKLAS